MGTEADCRAVGRVSGIGEGLVPVSWLSGWGMCVGLLALTEWVLQAGHGERPEQVCCLRLGSQKQNLGQNIWAISLFCGSDRGQREPSPGCCSMWLMLQPVGPPFQGTGWQDCRWQGREEGRTIQPPAAFSQGAKVCPPRHEIPYLPIMFMGALNRIHRVSPMEALRGGGGAWAVDFCPTELETSRAEKGPVRPSGSDSFVS